MKLFRIKKYDMSGYPLKYEFGCPHCKSHNTTFPFSHKKFESFEVLSWDCIKYQLPWDKFYCFACKRYFKIAEPIKHIKPMRMSVVSGIPIYY